MTEPDPTMRVVTALWHSNFRSIEVREDRFVYVRNTVFSTNALSLMIDLARSFDMEFCVYATKTGPIAMFSPKG